MNNVLSFDIDAITIVKLQAGTDVEVTWKVLEVPDETDVDVCEKKFKIEDLWNEESKETLACLKIPATVKACGDLSTTARAKIQGC